MATETQELRTHVLECPAMYDEMIYATSELDSKICRRGESEHWLPRVASLDLFVALYA
jgi:hypothetical protein